MPYLWSHRAHNVLMRIVRPDWLMNFQEFVSHLSWEYAHYQNPKAQEMYPSLMRMPKKSFLENVKDAWRARTDWQY